MRPAEQPADAESDGGGGVGPGLDRVAQDVFDGYGSRADAFPIHSTLGDRNKNDLL